MQAQTASRKRPAPGSSSSRQQQPAAQASYQYPQNGVQFPDTYGGQLKNDIGIPLTNSPFDPNLYSTNLQPTQPHTLSTNPNDAPAASNQLVRRTVNQQMAARNPGLTDQWNVASTVAEDQGPTWENMIKDEQELGQRAAAAKKDAQTKRKQIPPFVLKLWSFLNESRNTDLIRWTDNGLAFTVLDEDEFARTLIPELFKHNNYASFVRQLNMYGFHKKVSLQANSMKASEKKIKDPNVYWHEYFREGREDLLWLIQKPQTKSQAAKRKRGDEKREGDSDDDGRRATPDIADGQSLGRVVQGGAANQDLITLPRSDVVDLRREIQRLQRQQGVISKMIAQLKEQNEAFYRQATEFQSLHDRHENSINAILTFLATFYNKSLESGFNLNNLFGNNASQQQGTVVDVGDGDYAEVNTTNNSQQLQRYKRPQLLLEDSRPDFSHLQPGNASTAPNSARSSISPAQGQQRSRNPSSAQASSPRPPPRASVSPAIKDDAGTPNVLSQFSESDEMMSLINAANANTANTPNSSGPNFDFSSALNHAQNANGSQPLTAQQRNEMLNLITSQTNQQQPGTNNGLYNPPPPQMPNLDQYNRTQEQLEMLQRLQREQDSKVADLAGRLQPLSPNGTIPGLQSDGSYAMGGMGGEMGAPNSDFDLGDFLNDENYFAPNYSQGDGNGQGFDSSIRVGNGGNGNDLSNPAFDDDPTGLNFDFGNHDTNVETGDNTGNMQPELGDLFGDDDVDLTLPSPDGSGNDSGQDGGGRILESLSSEGTSPANTQSMLQMQDQGQGNDHGDEETPSKRLKRG